MKLLNYGQAVLLLALFAGACTKKTFEAVKEPAALIRINTGNTVNLIQEPMKDAVVTWETSIKSIDLEGVLRVHYKNTDFWFWQMKCPTGLKCNGEKVYFPVQATVSYDKGKMPFGNALPPTADYTAYVIKKEDEASGLALLALASSAKNPLPDKFLPELMHALIAHHDPKKEVGRNLMAYFYLIAQFGQWDKETVEKNARLAPLAQKYGRFTRDSQSTAEKGKDVPNSFITDLYKFMVPEYENMLKQIVKDFPWTAVLYNKLAQNFTELGSFLGAQEKIFLTMLSGGDIDVAFDRKNPKDGYVVLGKLFNLPAGFADKSAFEFKNVNEGLIFRIKKSSPPLEFHCSFTETSATAQGLRITLTIEPNNEATSGAIAAALEAQRTATVPVDAATKETEAAEPATKNPVPAIQKFTLQFESEPNSKYLNVFKKFEQDAKAMAKKVTPADFSGGLTHQSLFLFAIKYGEGGLDRTTGKFQYNVPLSRGKVYNTFLSMAKYQANGGSVSDTTYSGPIADGHVPMGGGNQTVSVNWYQSAKGGSYSFYIRGKIDVTYRSNNFSESVDQLCFEDNSMVSVEFDPAELQSGTPKVKAEFPTDGGICKSILSPKD